MRRGDEVLDRLFVLVQPGLEVGLVEDARALGLREDEVEVEEEAEVGVEGDPRRVEELGREIERGERDGEGRGGKGEVPD